MVALIEDIKHVTIENVAPQSLSPHARNIKIYGDEDVASLKERILATNWIKPLVVTQQNTIISGHRRWRSAMELGLKSVPVERRAFANEVDELEALLLENVTRAKTIVQKVNESETWDEIFKIRAEQKQQAQGDLGKEHGKEGGRGHKKEKPLVDTCPQGVSGSNNSNSKNITTSNKKKREPATRDLVAAQVGLGSGKNLERAKKAVDAANNLRSEGKVEEAKALEAIVNQPKGVNVAATVASLPKEEQVAVLGKIVSGQAKTPKAAILDIKKAEIEAQAQAEPTKPHITLASWKNWLPQQEQCDLLITDPPYSTDVDDIEAFANAWLPLALSKVKPTGRAYVCVGAYPQELQAYLNVKACMPVQQVLVWSYKNTIGPSPTYDYKLNWQAILYFRGPEAPALDCPIMNEQFSAQEINAPDGRQGDRYHAWQKPIELAERLIRHSTKPDDLVLDCFSGTGTFLLAAHLLGRIAHGCDQSPEMAQLAERRGCEVFNA